MSGLAVVILNYGDPADTLALATRLMPEAGVAAIVVVDNYSNDTNVARLANGLGGANGKVHFLPLPDNRGYAAGNNAGLAHAFDRLKADFALILNPDIEVQGDFTPRIASMIPPDRPAIYTGRIMQHGRPYSVLRYHPWTCKSARTTPDGNGPLYVSGCCFGFSRGIWRAFGGYWEGYFLQYEELDYIYRYRAEFGTFPDVLVDEGVSIVHHEGGSTGSAPLRASPFNDYWSSRSRIVFYRKFLGWHLPAAIAFNVVKAAFSLVRARTRNVGSILRGTIDGLRADT